MEHWNLRYPNIAFYLRFFPCKLDHLPSEEMGLKTWAEERSLEEIEIIYIIGLIGFPLPKKLANWIEEKRERALVFVEENLGAFAAFDDLFLIDHPQVHFHYSQTDPIEELAYQFPTDRLAVFEGKPFDVLELKRRAAAYSAIYSDILYSHKIVDNVVTHFQRLSNCIRGKGHFSNIPAIICGAGPSLEKGIAALKATKGKALLFAGGSAITALTLHDVKPHFAIALDPNKEEFDRLCQAHFFEGPFLFAPRLHRDVFSTANGPFCHLRTGTGGGIESWLEGELGIKGDLVGHDLGSEAFSVTTLAVSLAASLGCNPIIFAGVDLAYTAGKRYAKGIEGGDNSPQFGVFDEVLEKKDIFGNRVETLLKWVMESDCIAKFAREKPHIDWINGTAGGIGFEGIPNRSIEEALENKEQRDLEAEVHLWIQEGTFPLRAGDFEPVLDRLKESLLRCRGLCRQIIEVLAIKEGREVVLECDLKEEIAYEALLQGMYDALEQVIPRYFPHRDPEEARREQALAKYQELAIQIERLLPSLSTLREVNR